MGSRPMSSSRRSRKSMHTSTQRGLGRSATTHTTTRGISFKCRSCIRTSAFRLVVWQMNWLRSYHQVPSAQRAQRQLQGSSLSWRCLHLQETTSKWPAYCELFSALIINRKDLTDVERLQYLLSSLAGEPAQKVEALPLKGASFTPAWEMLKEAYANKCHLIQAQLDKLYASEAW